MRKPAETDYPIHDILTERWSPLAFAQRDVEPATLASLLEAPRWTASSFNEQPWRYIVATKAEPEVYQRLLSCLVPANVTWAQSAPVLMLSVCKAAFTHNGAANRVAPHDVGAAAASLTFQATSLGLVVHQMGGIYPDKAREEFGIPDGYEVMAALAVGYPGEPASLPEALRARETAPRTRKPLHEIAFGAMWNETPRFLTEVQSGDRRKGKAT